MRTFLAIIVLMVLVACSSEQATPAATTTPATTSLNIQITEEAAQVDELIETEEALVAETEESDVTAEAVATDETVVTEEAAAAVPVSASTPAELCAGAVPAEEPASREYTEPQQVLDPTLDYRAIFCTDAGPVYIDLFEDYAPVTVNSFVFLAQNGYYNNTIFHRVIQDFMAQAGDPTGTGRGGPGYQFKDEFIGFLNFDRPGMLAMANANNPEQGIVGTNGSQFFITTAETPHLDYRHTVFGEVLEGQENVLNVQIRDPQQADSPSTQLQTVLIVTDPAAVETTFTEAPPADAAEVIAAFAEFNAVVPPELEMVNSTEALTVETAAASVPEDLQADYTAFLESHDYQFGYSSLIDNTGCNLDTYAFMTLGYRLDAFATGEDAAAALAEGFLDSVAAAEGYEKTDISLLGGTLYSKSAQACNMNAINGRIYAQRGRFIVTIETTIPADRPYGLEQVLDQFAGRLYEFTLADILRREIRS